LFSIGMAQFSTLRSVPTGLERSLTPRLRTSAASGVRSCP
jgi:hypothetical protein